MSIERENMPDLLAFSAPRSRAMTDDEVRAVLKEALAKVDLAGRRVLVLLPDSTRTAPVALQFKLLNELLAKAAAVDYLVALGTHMPMNDAALGKLLGAPVADGRCGQHRVFNHQWNKPETFVQLGAVSAAQVAKFSSGMLSLDVPVRVNRLVMEYDQIIVCGPVFPHEVVGFSGGNKYFFPGIAGAEMINVTHWMGALLTSMATIGAADTPMRRMIDHAAGLIPTPKLDIASVMHGRDLVGLFAGTMTGAWKAAVELSAALDIIYVPTPFTRVLAVMPELYDDLWTGAKGMYKTEPAVADGGEVVIYAPHITEVSYAHGHILDEIGYHVRDYFLAQWEAFKKYPWGVLAHSTHVRGGGTFVGGVEKPRINVTLATSIPAERCRKIGLGYLDPAAVKPEQWKGREKEGILYVPRAGEMLYRIKAG
jgi:nickel-dependent lactate racemase